VAFELIDEKFENHLAPTHSAGFRIIGLKMQINYFGVFSLLGIVNFILHHDLKNAFSTNYFTIARPPFIGIRQTGAGLLSNSYRLLIIKNSKSF
jgi:hypothetical protein